MIENIQGMLLDSNSERMSFVRSQVGIKKLSLTEELSSSNAQRDIVNSEACLARIFLKF